MKIKFTVTTKSNCLIGSQTESFSIGGVDQSTTIDNERYPIIHASSFKGAFRNVIRDSDDMEKTKELINIYLDKLLQDYNNLDSDIKNREEIKRVIKNIEKYKKEVKAEYIFGLEGINDTPRLFFSDLKLIEPRKKQEDYFEIQTKNKIEEKGEDLKSTPRTYRVLKPNIEFSGEILFKCKEMNESLVNAVVAELKDKLKEFNKGFYGIGNSKSRGYGIIEIEVK